MYLLTDPVRRKGSCEEEAFRFHGNVMRPTALQRWLSFRVPSDERSGSGKVKTRERYKCRARLTSVPLIHLHVMVLRL
jgi:hypothetical protein